MDQLELIDKAMDATKMSQRKFAAHIGIDHSELHKMRTGDRVMRMEEAMLIAEMAKMPPVQTAARLRATTVKSKKVRALLQKIAASAAVVALGLAIYTSEATAAVTSGGYILCQIDKAPQNGDPDHPAKIALPRHGAPTPTQRIRLP